MASLSDEELTERKAEIKAIWLEPGASSHELLPNNLRAKYLYLHRCRAAALDPEPDNNE